MANHDGHHQWNVNHTPDITVDIFYLFSLLTYPNGHGGGMAILLMSQMREEPGGAGQWGGLGAGQLLRITGSGTSTAEIQIHL